MKLLCLFICIFIILWIPAHVVADTDTWRYVLGYGYLINVEEIKDSYKHLSKNAGNDNDIYNTSVSLCFQPYYQFQNGIRTGFHYGPEQRESDK